MKSLVFLSHASVILLLVILSRNLSHANEKDDEKLIDFLAENKLLQGKADIVFLLDRSGSVGAANFEIQKGFIVSLLTQVMVDANATRVAVISYSSDVVRHIDYLREPKNKCFLSQELVDVTFENSGATNIAAALNEASKVFQNARPHVNKVVILISDGLATVGGSPEHNARFLKGSGVQVFAFGVGRFLKTELLSLASSERHIYSCSEFKEFKQLAKKIRGDPHEVSWSGQASAPNCDHLCHSPYRGEVFDPGCCDHNARCSCALLSGMHTCVCGPGYFGLSGLAGQCQACPKGTYKSKTEPDEKCERCPPFSTTLKMASTSEKDCFCKEGYLGNISSGIPCAPVRCPILQNPTNGFILGECRNTYQSTCYFMCNEGFELEDKSTDFRSCSSDGTWTGKSSICRRIHCESLLTPTFGSKYCGSQRADIAVGATCRFGCLKGFVMQGSEVRECLPSKLWSGKEVKCLPKECPLPPAIKHGRILGCSTHKKGKFQDICIYKCNYGYNLYGSDTLTCNEQGKWTNDANQEERQHCIDVEPPQIRCPVPVKLIAAKGTDYVEARWKVPKPMDNSPYELKLITTPPNISPPHVFLIGVNRFSYTATDASGLSSSCWVEIEVLDKEPPMIIGCPSAIGVSSLDALTVVEWEEPVFQDNDARKEIRIQKNLYSGDKFGFGQHKVSYMATDYSGNKARCDFDITVSRTYCPYHPPPTNGAFTCEDWMYGQFCQAFCNDRYDFVHKPAEWYVCNAEAHWVTEPKGYPIPWPDCAKPAFPSKIRKVMSGFYYSGDCNDPRVRVAIKKQFLNHFTRSFSHAGLCNQEGDCTIDRVKVMCGRTHHTLSFRRRRRDVWGLAERAELEVEFDITISVDHELNNTNAIFEDFMKTIENLQWDIEEDLNMDLATQLPISANEIDFKPKTLEFTNEKTLIVCQPGSVLTDGLCVSCPAGTFYSNFTKDCEDCAIGYYQDMESQMQCKECPPKTSTEQMKTKTVQECKGICAPGTYSTSGVETCRACPQGTFQNKHGGSSCYTCPNGTTTSSVQSASDGECKEPCDSGSFSESGLVPCSLCPVGYYQPEEQRKRCLECPFPLSTKKEGAQSSAECVDYDPCVNTSVCEKGGQCLRSGREASCECQAGFSGNRCETDIDECRENPCLNNGSCANLVGSYRCNCSSGFDGETCENDVNECLSSPCLNNGTCIDKIDSYLCLCAHGYEGATCETYVETCFHDIICLNGGVCVNPMNESESHCMCIIGYGGSDCSINLNDCQNVTCSNHGRCIDGLASYTCACTVGYTGMDCEEEIDQCLNNMCSSGSTCKNLVGEYRCLCPPGWSGRLCENKLDSDFVLMFPEDQSSIANMASTTIASPMSHATVSMWVQTTDDERSGTPLSYAASSSTISASSGNLTVDNALTISDCSGVQVYVNNEPLVTDVNVSDGRWHHLAFTWSSDDSGSWNLYKDGKMQTEGKHLRPQDMIPGGGILIIGQEQDTVGGGFSPIESFTGNITRVNVWNSYFSQSNVTRLCNMDDEIAGKVVAWPDFLSNIKGNIKVIRNNKILTL